LRQRDEHLSEPGTKEVSQGESKRLVINVAGWLRLSLVNLAFTSSVLQGGAVDENRFTGSNVVFLGKRHVARAGRKKNHGTQDEKMDYLGVHGASLRFVGDDLRP